MSDLISRQAAIDAIVQYLGRIKRDFKQWEGTARIILDHVPSAQPSVSKSEMVGDVISRQGVLRLLNAVPSEEFATKAMLISGVNALPSTQPEIIHCKDCKYNPNPPECGNAVCVLFYGMTDQMGFCHHGERREQK